MKKSRNRDSNYIMRKMLGRELLRVIKASQCEQDAECKVIKLIQKGVEPDLVRDEGGKTSLMYACEKDFTNIAYYLIVFGADKDAQNSAGLKAEDYSSERTKYMLSFMPSKCEMDEQERREAEKKAQNLEK